MKKSLIGFLSIVVLFPLLLAACKNDSHPKGQKEVALLSDLLFHEVFMKRAVSLYLSSDSINAVSIAGFLMDGINADTTWTPDATWTEGGTACSGKQLAKLCKIIRQQYDNNTEVEIFMPRGSGSCRKIYHQKARWL
jgi:hypothetical protein